MDGKARQFHSGVVQRQDVALLRQLSGFESLHQSHGGVAQSGERRPVKPEVAGSKPAVIAMPLW